MVAGGAIGIISSLFGGGASAQDKQTAQQNASASGKTLDALAQAGNTIAQKMMAINGYDAATIGNSSASKYTGLGVDQYLGLNQRDFGLFYTKETGYNSGLLTYLDTMTKVDTSLKSITGSGIVSALDKIDYKWKTIIAQVGDSTDVQMAKTNDYILTITGMSADAIASVMDGVITATPSGEAGQAVVDKLESSIATSVRSMAEAQFASQIIGPIMQPLMAELVTGLMGGNLTQDSMAGMFGKVKDGLSSMVPMITFFAQALDGAGVSGYTAAAATTAVAASTDTLAAAEQLTIDQAKAATTSALAGLQRSISAEKTALQTTYTDATKIVNDQLSLVNTNISKLTSLGSSLTSTLNVMSLAGSEYTDRLAAQADISSWALRATTLGTLPLAGELQSAMSVVQRDASALYTSDVEYQRDFYKTRADLAAINTVAGTQLSAADSQATALNSQLDTLKASYDLQVQTLDAMYTNAQAQVDALVGVNNSVLSVADAIYALNGAGFSQAAKAGGSVSWATIPRYASGGLHAGGLAIVGDGGGPEVVDLPAGSRVYSNKESKGLIDVDALVKSNEQLRREMDLLKQDLLIALSMIAINTKSTADQVEFANFGQGIGS